MSARELPRQPCAPRSPPTAPGSPLAPWSRSSSSAQDAPAMAVYCSEAFSMYPQAAAATAAAGTSGQRQPGAAYALGDYEPPPGYLWG
ncbi:Hypothetical predicted protein [Podarcis lilfordi]|uniref:Uncharacterized protein n=1 Tax=Podarcis lilfordi TaxID=74358 RepID=A0AA35LCE3_9SAUR|nr:Hypothetical predicted protein [Podarcis lilfordi]